METDGVTLVDGSSLCDDDEESPEARESVVEKCEGSVVGIKPISPASFAHA